MRLLRHTILFAAALVFLFEAWLWDMLSAFWRWFADFPAIRKTRALFDSLIEKMPPYAALGLFVIPVVVIFPFKLAALWLIARGNFILGGLAFLLAKAAGMGAAAFLFELTRPKLMTIGWFIHLYELVLKARDWAHRLIDPYLQPLKNTIRTYRAGITALLGNRKSGFLAVVMRLRERIRGRRSAK